MSFANKKESTTHFKKNAEVTPSLSGRVGEGLLVILGAGESGVGTAILGKQKKFSVFVSDSGKIKTKYKHVLEQFEIDWEEKTHSEQKILNADLVMKSPGIPETVPIVKKLFEQGVPVVSEIEFASKFTDAIIVGITGSNGKTTVASWTDFMLKNDGLNVSLAGNIGESFAKQVAEKNPTHYVLELSSFQLDGTVDFRPHISVITNITPDHLNRYKNNFENYIQSKFSILKNQTETDYFIYDADDNTIAKWLETHRVKPKKIPLTFKNEPIYGAYLKDDKIIINLDNKPIEMETANLTVKGRHNVKNAMAAATVANLLRIRKQTIRESLERFSGVEHRMEYVLKIKNVNYINDSKATNPNATYFALDAVKTEIVWIAGGKDKGVQYDELLPLANEKVKAIICLGVDNSKIFETFGNCIDLIVEAQSMKEAVKTSYQLSEPGDTVLLSPGFESYDRFENFADRGRQFKEAVRNL